MDSRARLFDLEYPLTAIPPAIGETSLRLAQRVALSQAVDSVLPDDIPLFLAIGEGVQSLGVLDAVRRARSEQLAIWLADWRGESFWESAYVEAQSRRHWLRLLRGATEPLLESIAQRELRPTVVYVSDWLTTIPVLDATLSLVEELLRPQQLLLDGYQRAEVQQMVDRFLHRGNHRTLDYTVDFLDAFGLVALSPRYFAQRPY